MKGGLYIKEGYTPYTAFRHFIENSEISYLSQGAYGIILKCKLNEKIKSPYTNLRTIYKDKEVSMILIKFSLIYYNERYEIEFTSEPLAPPLKITSVTVNEFEDEVKMQTEIFNKTKDHLDPICPSIIYNNYDKGLQIMRESIDLIKIIHTKVNNIGVINLISKLLGTQNASFGIIGMELMDDYETLNNVNKKYQSGRYDCISKLRLIELAVKTGYSHNDFHGGNILVNPNATGYYGDKKGHVLLIDFGYTQKIPNDLLTKIKKLYDENKFNEILDIFINESRLFNGYLLKDYPQYGWILTKNTIDDPTNIKVTNDYIKMLKDKYKKYEELVDEKKKKTELPIIQDEEHKEDIKITGKRKAEGGKKKNNKSMKQKHKTNKRRQSKHKTNKRRQSKRNGK